jgi:restriction modification system DNA specificity domain protein (fragment)
MDTKALRQKILDLAIRGKLVPQDPNDEPASVLLGRIRQQKQQMVKEGKLKPKDIKNDSVIFVGEDNLHYEKFADGSVKCIEDEIPFDLPDGWAWAKINTIAFVTKLAGFEYTKNIAPGLCEDGIPLFKGKNVQNSTIVYEFESFIPESVSDELQRSQVTKKCILTPYVGTIGNIGIHNRPGKYHLGSNVGKIELYNDNVVLLEEYVVAYLQSGFGYQQLTKHMKATAQASISIEAIRDVYLPIPPANEQLRMWSALSNALAMIERIENTELDITNLIKSTKSKVLDLAIRGKLVPQDPNDEPASVLLERIRAEKEELIKQGKIKRDKKESVIFRGEDNSYYEKIGDDVRCIDEEIPFDIPDTWEWVRLENCCSKEIRRGKSPKYTERSGTLVFAQKCNTKYNGIDVGLALYLDEDTLSRYPADEYMQDGDVVVNSTGMGTLGRVGIYCATDNHLGLPIVPDSHVTVIRVRKQKV